MNDLLMKSVFTVAKLANLSVLDLLEHGFAPEDINEAMATLVIEFD